MKKNFSPKIFRIPTHLAATMENSSFCENTNPVKGDLITINFTKSNTVPNGTKFGENSVESGNCSQTQVVEDEFTEIRSCSINEENPEEKCKPFKRYPKSYVPF